ncbi:tryptophan-rich sensory protein [bacterium]|nr:tryptophan-rich sensory protein [bacterium]
MLDFSWYQTLNQPPLAPPGWIFSPVWSVLYVSMFIALFMFTKENSFYSKKNGYWLFLSQLLVNFSWTPVFFGLKNIGLALIISIILDVLVFFNIKEFYKISRVSGIILIPYFIWLIFATYLNLGLLILNPLNA